MRPFYSDEWLTLYGGDCREVMAGLPADSVDCVVTSPPYWGLRDYGHAGQLGLERTPEEYVANLVAVFAEVRRVLKPSGTCWLNLGDSYAGSWGANGRGEGTNAPRPDLQVKHGTDAPNRNVPGLKPKDLVGIPWRVAFALQTNGWYLRSDIIWAKPNPMPESVTDRPTKAHEYLFLLTKSARYYFDAAAVAEPAQQWNGRAGEWGRDGNAVADHVIPGQLAAQHRPRESKKRGEFNGKTEAMPGRNAFRAVTTTRNIRSVWTIATRPYPGAHFAVFPPELPERCIKAGSSERGVCPECGAPWERVVERVTAVPQRVGEWKATGEQHRNDIDRKGGFYPDGPTTTGWADPCGNDLNPNPAVILDPFAGSGTVGMVANRLSRRAILIDLNPEYLKQQMKRNAQTPLGLGAA